MNNSFEISGIRIISSLARRLNRFYTEKGLKRSIQNNVRLNKSFFFSLNSRRGLENRKSPNFDACSNHEIN